MKLEAGIYRASTNENVKVIVEQLSGNTNPSNFMGLCGDEGVIFVRDFVNHTKIVVGACNNTGLTIQAVVENFSDKIAIHCISYRNNGDCRVIGADKSKCPFHNDKKVQITNPVKSID